MIGDTAWPHPTEQLDPARLLDELPRTLVVVDVPSGRIEYVNRYTRTLLDDMPLVGRTITDVFPNADYSVYREALSQGEVVLDEVLYPIHGEPRCFQVTIRAYDGRRVVLSGVDITEQVRLRKRLEQREIDLQEALRVRDDFISMASHELRTPLTAILLHCARLRHKQVPDFVRQSIVRVEKAAHSVNSLISVLLDVARIQHGEIPMDPEYINLHSLMTEAENRLREISEEAGCEVRLTGALDVYGRWDRSCLETIASNLLTNAFKYGRGKPVNVHVARLDSRAFLTVRDEGVGISEDDQERIFGQFERVGIRKAAPGLGLGLWIVHRMVLAMGGKVDVDSRLGEGACFTVELPCA